MTLQPPQPSRYSHTDSKERNYQQIRVRQDTNENWLKNNPVPASGEWCYSIDGITPPTRYPDNDFPEPTVELSGTYIINVDYNLFRCECEENPAYIEPDSRPPEYDPETPEYICTWVDVGLKYEQPKVDENGTPYANQCLKIGNSNAPWSQLPWLGGRGPKGSKGDPGDGVRIIGVLGDCGEPTVDEAPDPEIGDMWVVSCVDREDSSPGSCMAECDGLAYVWDGSTWQSIGSIQGPPGNNVEYYYQEFAATDGKTEFQLDSRVQVQATFVTINGVILLPNDYTFTDNTYTEDGEDKEGCLLTFLNDIPLKDEDIIMVFSFKGAIDAAVRTLTTSDIQTIGIRPVDVQPVPRQDIKNQQEVNWYLMDAIDNIDFPEEQDLSTYETIVKSEAGDETTLKDSKDYTDTAIAAIEFPEAADLSGYAETTYVDGADQAVQRFATTADEVVLNAAKKYTDDSLGTIPEVSEPDVDKAYVDAQDATKIGNTGDQVLPTSEWKLRAQKADDSGVYSYLSIKEDSLALYHIADPTADAHGMSRGYADTRYVQYGSPPTLTPVVYKCDQYVKAVVKNIPESGEFSGMYNTAEGSATSANNYWGNVNIELRVHKNKLLDKNGNTIASGYRQSVAGYVTLIGKDNKMYLKAAIRTVTRPAGQDYIEVVFDNRTKPFGTGSYDSSDGYLVLIEGYEQ